MDNENQGKRPDQIEYSYKVIYFILKYAVIFTVLFYLIQGSFWLLNQKSSIANVAGFLSMLTIVTYGVIFIINEVKKHLNNYL